MTVVMGIIAFLLAMSVNGLYAANKQAKARASAELFISTVRQAANESISVSGHLDDPATPAKAWAIELTNGNGAFKLLSFSGSGSSLTRAEKITYLPSPVEVTYTLPDSSMPGGFNLIFSSPFAKFGESSGLIASPSTWIIDPVTKEATLSGSGTMAGEANVDFRINGVTYYTVKTNLTNGESSLE